jgi:hypothetical protein
MLVIGFLHSQLPRRVVLPAGIETVWWLMTGSNLVTCTTGRSAGRRC